jgi:protein-disulfide isomerase-like protein with CxxC motif
MNRPAVTAEVVEYTDPGCSWAWGSEPKLRLLRWRFGDRLRWRRVMGGLFGDLHNVNPDFDPVALAPHFAQYWGAVAERTGMPYPARLQWVYRSTEPACRAVKAAERQGADAADEVLRRLREATFVFGEPPDTPERIRAGLRGARGVDLDRLARDLDHPAVSEAFRADWAETREPNDYVQTLEDEGEGGGTAKHTEGHWRYVFPTVIVRGPEGERTVAGWKPYETYVDALEAAAPGVTADPRPDPTPEEVLAETGTAAARELELLCGGAGPPAEAVDCNFGGGRFWLTRQMAAARDLD